MEVPVKKRQNPARDQDLLDQLIAKLRYSEPVLHDPEKLTEKILYETGRLKKRKPMIPPGGRTFIVPFITVQRILTAASICLLIVFGAEQYHVVRKINILEQQNAASRIPDHPGIASRIAQGERTLPFLRSKLTGRTKKFLFTPELTINNVSNSNKITTR
jgi:hypothetical protein